jgi:hypothetical protein
MSSAISCSICKNKEKLQQFFEIHPRPEIHSDSYNGLRSEIVNCSLFAGGHFVAYSSFDASFISFSI